MLHRQYKINTDLTTDELALLYSALDFWTENIGYSRHISESRRVIACSLWARVKLWLEDIESQMAIDMAKNLLQKSYWLERSDKPELHYVYPLAGIKPHALDFDGIVSHCGLYIPDWKNPFHDPSNLGGYKSATRCPDCYKAAISLHQKVKSLQEAKHEPN